jgi:hypothetical protein
MKRRDEGEPSSTRGTSAKGLRRGVLSMALGTAVAAAASGSAWAQAQTWTAVDLGSFGRFTRASALNEAGQVVGASEYTAGLYRGFIASPPAFQMKAINPPGSTYSWAVDINDRSVVVGHMLLADGSTRAFITGPNGADPHELPLLPSSDAPGSMVAASAINNAGQVAGTVTQADGSFRFYITGPNGQGAVDLGPAHYGDGVAGITSTGQVLQSRDTGSGTACFLTGANGQGGGFVGVPAGMSCHPSDVEDSGRVLANLSGPGPAGWGSSFMTGANGTGITYLPDGLFAEDMNRFGVVIGSALATGSAGVERHAFVTGPGGIGMTDLNDRIDLPDGEYFEFGYGVNDAGQMVAESNRGRTFAINPVPEPSTALMMALGLGLALAAARRRG